MWRRRRFLGDRMEPKHKSFLGGKESRKAFDLPDFKPTQPPYTGKQCEIKAKEMMICP